MEAKGIQEVEVSVAEVVKRLRFNGTFAPALQEVVRRKLTVREAQRRGITVPDEELQRYADTFRIARGLVNAEDTFRWLEDIGVTPEDYEELMEANVLIDKVKDALEKEADTGTLACLPGVKEAVREAAYREWLGRVLTEA